MGLYVSASLEIYVSASLGMHRTRWASLDGPSWSNGDIHLVGRCKRAFRSRGGYGQVWAYVGKGRQGLEGHRIGKDGQVWKSQIDLEGISDTFSG